MAGHGVDKSIARDPGQPTGFRVEDQATFGFACGVAVAAQAAFLKDRQGLFDKELVGIICTGGPRRTEGCDRGQQESQGRFLIVYRHAIRI